MNKEEKALRLALEFRYRDDCPYDNIDVQILCKDNPDKCKSNGAECWRLYFMRKANKDIKEER